MSAAATAAHPQTEPTPLFEPSVNAGSSLEDVVLGAWEDLAARAEAECPVCGSTLLPVGCASCGSELS